MQPSALSRFRVGEVNLHPVRARPGLHVRRRSPGCGTDTLGHLVRCGPSPALGAVLALDQAAGPSQLWPRHEATDVLLAQRLAGALQVGVEPAGRDPGGDRLAFQVGAANLGIRWRHRLGPLRGDQEDHLTSVRLGRADPKRVRRSANRPELVASQTAIALGPGVPGPLERREARGINEAAHGLAGGLVDQVDAMHGRVLPAVVDPAVARRPQIVRSGPGAPHRNVTPFDSWERGHVDRYPGGRV
jgi:hypothetical protein